MWRESNYKFKLNNMKKLLLGIFAIVACASLNAQVNLDSGLVGCYPFSGNANDQSGHGNNGKVYGATLTKDRWGNPNHAYFFNRTDTNYISIANFPAMIPAHDVSISIWGKAIENTSQGLFMAVPDTEANRFGGYAEYTSGPFLIWDYGDLLTTGRMITTQPGYDSNWHHYVFVVSKTKNVKDLYLDGALVMSSAYTMDYNDYGRQLYIGGYLGWNGGPLSWPGYIDDVSIYNRALTAAEVTKLYNDSALVCSTEGIPSLSESGLKIFKSSENEIQIKVGDIAINGNVQIVNVLGQVMKTERMNAATYSSREIDITNLARGIYMVVLTSGNERYTQKFIK